MQLHPHFKHIRLTNEHVFFIGNKMLAEFEFSFTKINLENIQLELIKLMTECND